jgi:hypothetical protein
MCWGSPRPRWIMDGQRHRRSFRVGAITWGAETKATESTREGEIQMMALLSIGYHGHALALPPLHLQTSIACLRPWPAPAEACVPASKRNPMRCCSMEDDAYGKDWTARERLHSVTGTIDVTWFIIGPVILCLVLASLQGSSISTISPSGLEKDLVRFFFIFPFHLDASSGTPVYSIYCNLLHNCTQNLLNVHFSVISSMACM